MNKNNAYHAETLCVYFGSVPKLRPFWEELRQKYIVQYTASWCLYSKGLDTVHISYYFYIYLKRQFNNPQMSSSVSVLVQTSLTVIRAGLLTTMSSDMIIEVTIFHSDPWFSWAGTGNFSDSCMTTSPKVNHNYKSSWTACLA